MDEPACHAYAGVTERTSTLFGAPGHAYVYFSYGVHSLLNAVAEEEGVGAAVLIRALEPVDGIEVMRERRGVRARRGALLRPRQAHPGARHRPVAERQLARGRARSRCSTREPGSREPRVVIGERIGITKAADLPWRFCDADSRHVSRPWPARDARGARGLGRPARGSRRRRPAARGRRGLGLGGRGCAARAGAGFCGGACVRPPPPCRRRRRSLPRPCRRSRARRARSSAGGDLGRATPARAGATSVARAVVGLVRARARAGAPAAARARTS